ncbi:MAG: L-seryl-tRNA(Sec) selenium transferase [Gemmatimonadetes bacterium]|nr:L-seryl-tRNA(Sec) selenium transferase [Gemmatimonadota bacterium]
MNDPRRSIPAVEKLLDTDPLRALQARFGRERTVSRLREVAAEVRHSGRFDGAGAGGGPESDATLRDPQAWARAVERALTEEERGSLRRVLNATGVVLHTNLGRAPLAAAAVAAIARVASGYSNLEFDLVRGERGSRYDHCVGLLTRLTGAEDALVVNNNAAALVLALNTIALGGPVLVSRGELVEIGGGFRIPEMLERAGAVLVEVGTTNRTRLADYERAAAQRGAAALLKVHRSNFRIEGFTEEVPLEQLAGLARALGVPLVHDLGSGLLVDPGSLGLPAEPRARESLAAGADLVCVSGDKALGGPQAGIVVGRAPLVRAMRSNPLTRALRVDKGTLAALEVTLRLSLDPATARAEIPALRMIAADPAELKARAQALASGVTAASDGSGSTLRVAPGRSVVGGGTFPGVELPGWTVRVAPAAGIDASAIATALRAGDPPVVARVEEGELVLDLRTVDPEDDALLARRLRESLAGSA